MGGGLACLWIGMLLPLGLYARFIVCVGWVRGCCGLGWDRAAFRGAVHPFWASSNADDGVINARVPGGDNGDNG